MSRGGLGAVFLVFGLLAGCVGSETGGGPAAIWPEEGPMLRGTVIDAELLPVAGAVVYVGEGEPQTLTGEDGTFALGPLDPGTYQVTAEKVGYEAATLAVVVDAVAPARVTLQLTAVASDVPFHATQAHAVTIGCAFASPTMRITCGLVNQVAGQPLLPDKSVFGFTIPNEGLAMLLVETAWKPATAFARELSVNILDRQGDQTNCITTKCYTEAVGPSPIRFRLVPGERWGPEPYQPFPGEMGHGFNTYLMPPFGSANNPASLYLDQRVDSYFSFFYNRLASEAFTALPDT